MHSRSRWTMLAPMTTALLAVLGYLLGSVPWANVVAARAAGLDLRGVGDRNPGYWNARAHLGRAASVAVFVGDTLKGVLPVLLARLVEPSPWWVGYVVAAAAMTGHAWPVFAHFRGGRSILCFSGAMCVLAPLPALVAVAVVVIVSVVTRRFAFGARAGIFGFPVIQACFEARAHVAACGALMSIIGLRFALATFAERGRRDSPHPGEVRPG